MPSSIPQWKNKTGDPNFEELSILLKQIIDYLDALDARLTAGGIVMAKKTAWDWALTSGLSTGIGAKKKGSPSGGGSGFQSYSGLRPPRVNYDAKTESPISSPGNILRPVQQMITDTVMRRSQGQDVGYDPARRDALQENFDIQQNRDFDNQSADNKNRLAGQGLSRNVAANDEVLGRALRAKNEEKSLYTNRINIEDLARRNDERDSNTGRLQALNAQNFGQENNAANFDLSVYGDENSGRDSSRRTDLAERGMAYAQKQDPLGTALELAGQGAGLYADYQTGGAYSALSGALKSGQSPTYNPTSINQIPTQGYKGSYFDPMALALKSGKNFSQ